MLRLHIPEMRLREGQAKCCIMHTVPPLQKCGRQRNVAYATWLASCREAGTLCDAGLHFLLLRCTGLLWRSLHWAHA